MRKGQEKKLKQLGCRDHSYFYLKYDFLPLMNSSLFLSDLSLSSSPFVLGSRSNERIYSLCWSTSCFFRLLLRSSPMGSTPGSSGMILRRRKATGVLLVPRHQLAPLIEGPVDPATASAAIARQQEEEEGKKDYIVSWPREVIRLPTFFNSANSSSSKRSTANLKLALGILACPLAPISLPAAADHDDQLLSPLISSIKDTPLEASTAMYIVQQYLAATGWLMQRRRGRRKSMYVAGTLRMACGEIDTAAGRMKRPSSTAARCGGGQDGCFVLWQMTPGMWLVELVSGGHKVVAGSNGKIIWRNMSWLGMNVAQGPQRRPLRRIIQGLDPMSTASMFSNAECLGEKRVAGDACFVLKASAERPTTVERGCDNDGPAEVIRHVLYGYFSQRSGLLVHLEDSHLTRTHIPGSEPVYWETTIGTTVDDYHDVDGVIVAHHGHSVATVFRFGSGPAAHGRLRMEETWRIDDVVFDVPGLSADCFIPPAEILNAAHQQLNS